MRWLVISFFSLLSAGTGWRCRRGNAAVNCVDQMRRLLRCRRRVRAADCGRWRVRRERRWDVRVTNPDGSSSVGAGLLRITP